MVFAFSSSRMMEADAVMLCYVAGAPARSAEGKIPSQLKPYSSV